MKWKLQNTELCCHGSILYQNLCGAAKTWGFTSSLWLNSLQLPWPYPYQQTVDERDQSYRTILFVTKGCAHWDDMTTLKVFAPNNRKENFQMNDLEKEQIKPKTRTKKERIESRNQWNRKQATVHFFLKINKINKLLARLITKTKWENKITNIRNGKGKFTREPINIK